MQIICSHDLSVLVSVASLIEWPLSPGLSPVEIGNNLVLNHYQIALPLVFAMLVTLRILVCGLGPVFCLFERNGILVLVLSTFAAISTEFLCSSATHTGDRRLRILCFKSSPNSHSNISGTFRFLTKFLYVSKTKISVLTPN